MLCNDVAGAVEIVWALSEPADIRRNPKERQW